MQQIFAKFRVETRPCSTVHSKSKSAACQRIMDNLLLLVLAFLFCVGERGIDGANILMLPLFNASHFLEMDGVGSPLVSRGHNVYVLFDTDTALPKSAGYYKVVRYHNPIPVPFHQSTKLMQKTLEDPNAGLNINTLIGMVSDMCENMMSDPDLFERLRGLNLDLVLIDNVPAPCFYLVTHKLGLPFITIGSALSSWSSRVPVLPSVVQSVFGLENIGIDFCEETDSQLGFVRRLCRLVSILLQEKILTALDSKFSEEYSYPEYPSVEAIRENVSLALVNTNHLISSPLPKLPNVEYVGGLTIKPTKPLESGLAAWMAESADVVIVSFGSLLASPPPSIANKFIEAFGRLSTYRFLWRFKVEESKSYAIPSNVRLMDWLPQSDALAHNSTRLFITHSGNNGQQEAVYHGVPMLCFYVLGDQKSNAKRVVQKGYGKMMSVRDSTSDQIVDAVSDFMLDSSYRERVQKASRVFRSEKHPSERAADAVEHVLEYGSEHLRPVEAYKQSVWEFYMLDVLGAGYMAVFLAGVVLVKLARKLLRLCTSQTSKKKVD